ncbi:MAG: hypothetical protein ACK50Q_07550 [Labrys sp. (in: a-proteobacteria)]
MRSASLKGTLAAVMIAATCHAATAAGPVAPLDAPSQVVTVKNGRNAAAAVGAVAGAAIMLGILGGAANASTEEYYVAPNDYGYVEPDYDLGGGYHDYVRRNPRSAAEICRKGVLRAARQYGARRAVINSVYGIRYTGEDTVKFRAAITVYYPNVARRSVVVCTVQDGYLIGARAEK